MTDEATAKDIQDKLDQLEQQAFERGRAAAMAEQPPDQFTFSNGAVANRDTQDDGYLAELQAKRAELIAANQFRPNHEAFREIMRRHGR